MSAAMLIEAWGDTMLTTALLVLAVLLIRKPFARHFGARLTYSLWLIPALRLILPPLPFADPVTPQVAATSPETTVIHWTVGPQTVDARPEEHTSELQSLMRISYAVFCLKKKKTLIHNIHPQRIT